MTTSQNVRTRPAVAESVIAAAQAGDSDAFATIYAEYQARLYNYAYRMMGNPEDAFDLTQDTFVKAWKAIGRTAPGLSVASWLFRIATNVCLDELRHRKLVYWQPLVTENEAATDTVFPQYYEQAAAIQRLATTVGPEEIAEQQEAADAVQAVLDGLRYKYRTVLILRECRQLDYEGIGEVMGLTRASVKSLLFRARDEFHWRWVEQHPEDALRSDRKPRRRYARETFTALRQVLADSPRAAWKAADLAAALVSRGVPLPDAHPAHSVANLLRDVPGVQYNRTAKMWQAV